MNRFWIFLLLILYILLPYDLIPDFLVGPGWLDDLGLMGLLAYYYLYRQRKQGKAGTGEKFRQNSQAKREQGAPSRRSPHEVLGLDPNATSEEIRAAYRRLVNQYHPDKVSHLGEEFRVLAEQKFKEIQEAYQELSSRQS
jgi:DnaJ domain/Protein of unknown function (DUF1232)